jgi:sigma-B regulation protein RsbU (phosphoserine phosphatase)
MKSNNVYNLFESGSEQSLDAQLTLLAEVVQSFASSLDINESLHNAIEKFIQYLNAEAASIFLLTDDKQELVCRGCAGPVDIDGLRLPATAGIVGKTVTTRSSQIVRDVREDPDFSNNVDKDTGFETRSILCAPLMVQDDCIGCLELINKRGGDGLFDKRDENILAALASAAALAIHNARMADVLVVQERMQKELELAREIQESLLPRLVDENFQVQGLNFPAREVSGDFYDFFQREDGLIYFNLADVSGKGMNAALLMAKISSLLHHLAKVISDPGELLSRVNDEICETVSHGMFVTLVSGFIDPKTNIVKFSNAGHQPPLYHSRDNKFEELPATAPPVGIMAGMDFPVTTLSLDGGSLYIFTDGVTESMDEAGVELEVNGLIDLIKTDATTVSSKRLDSIVSKIRRPTVGQHDDITILLIECSNT